jgi:hypothetical protein
MSDRLDDFLGDDDEAGGKAGEIKDGAADKGAKDQPETSDTDGDKPDPKPKPDDAGDDHAGNPDDDAETEPGDDDPAELKKQLATLNKRFKDTQANWTKEHQARLDLEKTLKDAEAKAAAAGAKKADDGWGDDNPGDTQAIGTTTQIEKDVAEIKAALSESRKAERLARWEVEEAKTKQAHADYDEVVYGLLEPELKKNPDLQKKFQEKGGSPEEAYKLGQELLEAQLEALPKAIRERIKTKDVGDTDTGNDDQPATRTRKPSTLDDVPGVRTGGKKATDDMVGGSVLDEVIAENGRKRRYD